MFSFGNMGFPSAECQKDVIYNSSSPIQIYMECQNTTFISSEHLQSGIMTNNDSFLSECSQSSSYLINGGFFNEKEFKKLYLEQCEG